jgi:hypothetical protein
MAGSPAGTGIATVVGNGPTVFPSYTGEQFGARTERNFPRGWASADAVSDGGVADAFFDTIGGNLATILADMIYALKATRIQTETSPEIDNASIDFFGPNVLPRPAGYTDTQYYNLILQTLFRQAITRPAISNALAALTGSVPRMLEPWSINDTGHWNGNPTQAASYWNADTVANPARWGNGALRYQGFIETAQPATSSFVSGSPILGWGGTPGANSAYWNVPGYFFGIIQQTSTNSVYTLIDNLKAEGTLIWVKIVSASTLVSAVKPTAPTSLVVTGKSATTVSLSWGLPVTGTTPLLFTVFYSSGGGIFLTGPQSNTTSVTVTNLTPGVTYTFEVGASNAAGNSPTSNTVSAVTGSTAPSQAQFLQATVVQSNAVTLTWQAPAVGTPPFTYTVLYRVNGTTTFSSLLVGTSVTAVTVIGLTPNTLYDFEVQTVNT